MSHRRGWVCQGPTVSPDWVPDASGIATLLGEKNPTEHWLQTGVRGIACQHLGGCACPGFTAGSH